MITNNKKTIKLILCDLNELAQHINYQLNKFEVYEYLDQPDINVVCYTTTIIRWDGPDTNEDWNVIIDGEKRLIHHFLGESVSFVESLRKFEEFKKRLTKISYPLDGVRLIQL